MTLLPLGAIGTEMDRITLDSPDGKYTEIYGGDVVYKRGGFLYRDYSTGPRDYIWDLDYPTPEYRDYERPTMYRGPEDNA